MKLCIERHNLACTGEAAVEARNVFYYLTYAGAVDLDAVTDTKMRKVSK